MDSDMADSDHSVTGFMSLPPELLIYIWEQTVLTGRDVCALASVCHRFSEISRRNEVWLAKFKQRWPDSATSGNLQDGHCWRDMYHNRQEICHKVKVKLTHLACKYYVHQEVPDVEFLDLFPAEFCENTENFMMDEVQRVLFDGNKKNWYKRLTEKYYAQKMLRCLSHRVLQRKLWDFLHQPAERQSLETGALLVAQWCQPTEVIHTERIRSKLDEIGRQVLEELGQRHRNNPACAAALRTSDEDLKESLWSGPQCRQILVALNDVLFKQLQFSGNTDNYYDRENSYINKVLETKTGIPISLCVLYSCIAKRLGVLCVPVGFPGHFLLKWREHTDLYGDQQWTYIDVFNEGRFLAQHECGPAFGVPTHFMDFDCFIAISTKQVLERMARNLVHIGRQQGHLSLMCLCNALELLHIFCPSDQDKAIFLSKVYRALGILDMKIVESMVNGLTQNPRDMAKAMAELKKRLTDMDKDLPKITPKRRSANRDVEFSVGMIMQHKRYDYLCVIYAWDNKCEATEEWIQHMGVHLLPKKQHQPFYSVFVEDGSMRYAAQENLTMAPSPCVIPHPTVGKYFQEFQGGYYLPNHMTLAEFPDDLEVTRAFVQEKYGPVDLSDIVPDA